MRLIKGFFRSEMPSNVWQVLADIHWLAFKGSNVVAWDVQDEPLVDNRDPVDAWLLSQGCSKGETVAFFNDM